MTLDAALLSAAIAGIAVLLPAAASALRRSGVLSTVERLQRERAVVQIVREQHRMAALPLPPGSELSHSVDNGLQLIVRPSTVGRTTGGELSNKEVDGSETDEPLSEEALGVLRDAQPAIVLDRPTSQPLRAVWNGDSETVERIVPAPSDGPVTRVEPGKVGDERPAKPGAVDFDSFYLIHKLALLAKLIPFCANDRHLAEDVVHDALLVAYIHLQELPELDDQAAWLYTVATRIAMRYFEREALRDERTRMHCAAVTTLAEPDESVLLRDLLHRVLNQQEREVVEYRYLGRYPRQWIAEQMGFSLRTVDNRISAALTKLRRHLAQSEEDES